MYKYGGFHIEFVMSSCILWLMQKVVRILLRVIVGVFALIGVLFVGVYVAMQYGWLNVRGSITERNSYFLNALKEMGTQATATTDTARTSTTTVSATTTIQELVAKQPCIEDGRTTCPWYDTPEWAVVSAGIRKDQAVIARVAEETGVPARLIVTVVVPEQIRFFTSNREVFKRYFEPLKILGTLVQFSLGVSGIKEDTARAIEQHLIATSSPFYPDEDLTGLVAYDAARSSDTVYSRLTNEKDHYYSYLYTALFVREIEAQWAKSGYDITHDPGTIVTLFNVGFGASKPHADPQPGGAPIAVGGTVYAYGELGAFFYFSNQMTDIFPRDR